MSDKNNLYKQNITRAMRAGMNFDMVSGSVQDVQHVSFSSQLYESSMLRHSADSETGQLYFRFRGYSRLSDKQKCIEEVIRQAEIYHEDQIGIQVIRWIQDQTVTTRYKYLSSAGLLFGMKFSQLELYPYNTKKHPDIYLDFFEKALSASVPPIDVIRYYRLITEGQHIENEYYLPLILHPNSDKIEIGTTRECKEEVTPSPYRIQKTKCSRIPLYNLNQKPIIVQDEEGNDTQLEIEYYPNDSLETIKLRYAIINHLPYETVYMEVIDKNSIEEEMEIEGVNIQFIANKPWRYNPLEHKKIVCTSIIDLIEQYPIHLQTTETIISSINTLSSQFQTYCNIDKKDGYYIYLLVRSIFFDGLEIVNEEETECIPSEDIIQHIENQIDYIEILLAKPIDTKVFKIVIENYCKRYLETLKIGNKYVTLYPDEEESYSTNIFECLRGVHEYKKEYTQPSMISPIHETNFTIAGELQVDGTDIYEYFNLFECNQTVPFLNLHHFYKCLNGAKCPSEWANPEEENIDTLRFYMCQIDLPDLRDEHYSLCELKQIKSEKGIFYYEYIIYGTVHTEIQLLLTKFLQVCPVKPSSMTVKKQFGKGLFICSGVPFNEDLFYDFATNEKLVSEMVTIDEKYKIHKIRGGLKFVVHLNRMDQTNVLKCVLRTKIIERSNEPEIRDFPHLVKIGQSVLSIQCSGTLHPYLLQFYKYMLDSFFYYMYQTYPTQVTQYYCNYIENIKEIVTPISKPSVIRKELTLKDLAPDLFLPGYVRSCSHPPTIVQEEQLSEIVNKGFQVMRFPKEDSGLLSHNYVCTKDKKKPYPGLRINDMDNAEIYPAIPCCYQDNQDSQGTLRYKYEHDIPLTDGQPLSTNFISTRKCLKHGQEGILPSVVKHFLTTTDNDCLINKSQFIRIAVPKGNWSVFDALQLATGKVITQEDLYTKCMEYVNMNLCSQSNLTIHEAVHILQSHSYIEVRDWYPILEQLFQVKIAIFATTRDNLEGELSYPNYKRFYIINPYVNMHFKHMVLLFNTYGGEFDRLTYPHNELIVKKLNTQTKAKQYTQLFPIDGETAKAILSVSSLLMNQRFIPFKLPISTQKSDGYGKIREINIQSTSLYTSPLPPTITNLGVALEELSVEQFITLATDHEFTKIESIQHNQLEIGVSAIHPENNTQIIYKWDVPQPIREDLPTYVIDIDGYPIPPSSTISFLKEYNYYQRLSNVITSYALYLFSTLKYAEKLTLEMFYSYIIVDKNHSYTTITRSLDLQNTSFIQNNKLIVTSENIKTRVIYYIKMCLEYNESFLDAYRFNRYIPFYYNNSEDFTKSIEYTVYNHVEEYLETRRLKKPQYTLYSSLFKSKTSYFFSNPLVRNGKLFLVIPFSTKEQAIACSSMYYTKGMIYSNSSHIIDESFTEMDATIVEFNQIQNEIRLHSPIKSRIKQEIYIGKYVILKSKQEITWFSMLEYKNI